MKCSTFIIAIFCSPGFAYGAGAFTRNGDLTLDGRLDISDTIALLESLFLGGPPPVEIECAPCDSCCPEVSKPLATGITRCIDPVDGKDLDECPEEGEPGFGQDGDYQAGASRQGQYEVMTFGNPDQTKWVTVDYATGLMWQYYPAYWDGSVVDADTLVLAGFDDWRLPNVFEALSIMLYPIKKYYRKLPTGTEIEMGRAAINFDAFYARIPSGFGTGTSTRELCGWGLSYGIGYSTGTLGAGSVLDPTPAVRCVRSITPDDLRTLGLPQPAERIRTPGPNGDLDGDGNVDLSDALYLLRYLYLGGPAPVEVYCPGCDTCCPDFPARLVKTGANICVKDPFSTRPCGTGDQDGDLQIGLPRIFILEDLGSADTRDWVTVDPVLSLMWQYEMESEMNWPDGLAYCEGLDLAGFEDWRMPNLFEFMSLFHFGRCPAVYQEYFSWPTFHISSYNCWTSTLVLEYRETNYAERATVHLSNGNVQVHASQIKANPDFIPLAKVRAVRTLKPGDLDLLGF